MPDAYRQQPGRSCTRAGLDRGLPLRPQAVCPWLPLSAVEGCGCKPRWLCKDAVCFSTCFRSAPAPPYAHPSLQAVTAGERTGNLGQGI